MNTYQCYKNLVSFVLIFRHIQCLHLMYSEVTWVLVSSETHVERQIVLVPDYLSVSYDCGWNKAEIIFEFCDIANSV